MRRPHMPFPSALLPLPNPRLLCLSAVVLLLPGVSAAQMRPTALKGATVFTGNGRIIHNGTLLIQGGRVSRVGKDIKTPFLTKGISARGKFITPGLIDVWSTLALRSGGAGGHALARAEDAFDRYATHEINAALARGVTAVYLPARGTSGIGGLGAVVRLKPGAAPQEVLVAGEVAVCATIGIDATRGPLARVKEVRDFRKRWQTAKDYREAREDYKESLEEYEEKLKKGADEPAKDKPKEKKTGDGAVAESDSIDGPPRRRPRRGGKTDQPTSKPSEKKKDGPKKPKEPPRDSQSELLLRVMDGELPLRVEVHRPQDILNVLEVAGEFNLRLIIEGASGAHLVADKLAEADVPVILGRPAASMRFDSGPRRYTVPDAAARLIEAGVDVYLGSGPHAPTRRLALLASQRVGHGFDQEAALQTITSGAARLLGIEDQLGTLARGMPADFVVWSGHPFKPGARVEKVYIEGVEVYRADSGP